MSALNHEPTTTGDAAGKSGASQYWNKNSQQWNRIAPPLRPSAPDIRVLEQFVRENRAAREGANFHALMLGVTPEIATMQWPGGTKLIAVDHSPGMIETVWPLGNSPAASALCAKWEHMPLPSESFDVALTDACYSQLIYPADYEAATRELRRVMKCGGQFIFRTFIKPENAETVAEVFAALDAGSIGGFHIFKWRLIMAIQKDLASGARLADVWNVWNEKFPDLDAFAARMKWPRDIVSTIDAYRGAEMRYTYPTLRELRAVLAPYFSETACIFPTYEMGDRCPILVFTAK